MRSLLIAPGDDKAKLEAAMASEADAVVIDLDLPGARREAARANAASLIREARAHPEGPAPMVRIGALGGGETDRDLDAVIAAAPCAVLLPRAGGRAYVQQLSVKIALREALSGLEDGATGIIALADSPDALLAVGSFPGASARLVALAWDAEALRAELGAEAAREASGAYASPLQIAREMTLFAAVAAGVAAIDSPFDEAGEASLHAEAEAARRHGFEGKLARDPRQARIINEAFARKRTEQAG
jgi:citrate lyase subunit beta / citryl-CoA lyase